MKVWSEGQPDQAACPNCGYSAEQARDEHRRRDHVAALLVERAGYEQHGRADRVAEVDKQLAYYGYEAGPAAKKRR